MSGAFSIWHILILGVVIMIFFGKGKISEVMGDAAKGIKAFKKGMSDEEEQAKIDAAKAVETKAAEVTEKAKA